MSTTFAELVAVGRSLLRGIGHLIYPPTCWTCGVVMPVEQGPVCATCLPRLTKDPFATCPRCSSSVGPHLVLESGCVACMNESFAFDGAFRMAPYEGLLREVILRMKAWTGEELTEAIARLWATQMAARLAPVHADVLIPVPLHWTRRWRRGFNPSELLALALASELRIPCRTNVLWRSRRTPPQTAQPSATARKENVKHAFAVRGNADFADKTLLLVDDVLTTGATLSEAARALRALKPRAIYVAVLTHGK